MLVEIMGEEELVTGVSELACNRICNPTKSDEVRARVEELTAFFVENPVEKPIVFHAAVPPAINAVLSSVLSAIMTMSPLECTPSATARIAMGKACEETNKLPRSSGVRSAGCSILLATTSS